MKTTGDVTPPFFFPRQQIIKTWKTIIQLPSDMQRCGTHLLPTFLLWSLMWMNALMRMTQLSYDQACGEHSADVYVWDSEKDHKGTNWRLYGGRTMERWKKEQLYLYNYTLPKKKTKHFFWVFSKILHVHHNNSLVLVRVPFVYFSTWFLKKCFSTVFGNFDNFVWVSFLAQ